MTIIVLNIV
jgi:uncharacterized membrane protein